MELLTIALNALSVNKLRAFLTVLGVVIGVAAVILLVSIGSGLTKFVTDQFEEFGTDLLTVMPGKVKFGDAAGREGGPSGGNNKLRLEDVDSVKRRGNLIENAIPVAIAYAEAKYQGEARSIAVLGTTSEYETVRKSPAGSGRFFSKNADLTSKKEVVLGQTVVTDLKLPADPAGERLKINGQVFTITGILESKGSAFGNDQDNLVIIPMSAFTRLFDVESVSYIYAKVKDTKMVKEAKTQVEEILLKRLEKDDFSVIDPTELLKTASSVLGAITAALGGIAAISLLVGGIGIANIMLVSVTERIKEIGLRKALGATPKDILLQFLIEAVILSAVGGFIGIVLGITFSWLLSFVFKTYVTWWSVVMAFSIASIVGIVAGVGPAFKAARQNPIDALRHE